MPIAYNIFNVEGLSYKPCQTAKDFLSHFALRQISDELYLVNSELEGGTAPTLLVHNYSVETHGSMGQGLLSEALSSLESLPELVSSVAHVVMHPIEAGEKARELAANLKELARYGFEHPREVAERFGQGFADALSSYAAASPAEQGRQFGHLVGFVSSELAQGAGAKRVGSFAVVAFQDPETWVCPKQALRALAKPSRGSKL